MAVQKKPHKCEHVVKMQKITAVGFELTLGRESNRNVKKNANETLKRACDDSERLRTLTEAKLEA